MKKLVSVLLTLAVVLGLSLTMAVPVAAGGMPWDAQLRAEITSPSEGEIIAVGSTFTVNVTIYNDGTGDAEAVDVDCVLNGGWPAGEYPDPENLAFAGGETEHQNTPPDSNSSYGYEPIVVGGL